MPATSCFPLLLHATLLTPFRKTGPFEPETRFPDFKSAMNSSPFAVTIATRVEVGSGFGTRARSETPFVETDNVGCAFPCVSFDVSKTEI